MTATHGSGSLTVSVVLLSSPCLVLNFLYTDSSVVHRRSHESMLEGPGASAAGPVLSAGRAVSE